MSNNYLFLYEYNLKFNVIIMKNIYCIEKWSIEDQDIHRKYNNECEFWNCIEEPWKIGCWSFIEEYDNEEEFKTDLMNIINHGGIVGKVFIKEVDDAYEPSIKL